MMLDVTQNLICAIKTLVVYIFDVRDAFFFLHDVSTKIHSTDFDNDEKFILKKKARANEMLNFKHIMR